MSYSRWSSSVWYTFWTSNFSEDCEFKLPTKRLKNNQYFEICDFGRNLHFSYKEINDDVDSCIKKVVEKSSERIESKMFKGFNPDKTPIYEDCVYEPMIYSKSELDELKGYMLEFKDDIDKYFKFKEFFYMNWYVPIKYYFRTKKIKIKK